MEKNTSAGPPGMGGSAREPKEQAARRSFAGLVECPLFTEQAKLTLNKDGLLITASFDQLPVPYGEITGIALTDYRVEIQTAGGMVGVSYLGQAAEWLYNHLYAIYNNAVLKALLVEGNPSFEAEGDYISVENGQTRQDRAVFRLYEDCLCILPPGEQARRIPLCFLTSMEKSCFGLTLALSTGERYTLQQLGRELDNLERLLTDGLRALRERTLEWLKELVPGLSSMQAAMAAKLMPLGTAASMEKLSAAAPPLAGALEQKISESRMAQTYPWLRALCGCRGLRVGALPPPEKKGQKQPAMQAAGITGVPEDGREPNAEPEQKPILWAIAPGPGGRVAAVELALADEEAAATYLYRVDGDWETFARLLDRALEAIGFRREVILMPDEKLNAPEHLADAILVNRTPALRLLRSCFTGRAIHSSPERWRQDIENCCGVALPAEPGKRGNRQA